MQGCTTVEDGSGVEADVFMTWGQVELENIPATNTKGRLLTSLSYISIGAIGFEPTTSRSRTERSTRLSHAPFWRRCILPAPSPNCQSRFPKKRASRSRATVRPRAGRLRALLKLI